MEILDYSEKPSQGGVGEGNRKCIFPLPLIPSHEDISLKNRIIAGGENCADAIAFATNVELLRSNEKLISSHIVEFVKVFKLGMTIASSLFTLAYIRRHSGLSRYPNVSRLFQ